MVHMGQNVRACGDNARPNFPKNLIRYATGAALGVLAGLAPRICHAAEFGTGPWLKGYSDIFAGIVPSAPTFEATPITMTRALAPWSSTAAFRSMSTRT